MVQAGDEGEKAWALSRALLFDEADVTAFLCYSRCVFAKKQKGSQICGSGLGHGAFHFLQGLLRKISLYLPGINSASPQSDHTLPMLEFKRCLPFSFFCLGQTIDILGRGCINSQDLILVKATWAWLGASRNRILQVSVQQLLADSFVPFPDAHPCPPSPRTPSVPHQQEVLFCLGLPQSCWHNKAVLFLAEHSASELSCGWSPFFCKNENSGLMSCLWLMCRVSQNWCY